MAGKKKVEEVKLEEVKVEKTETEKAVEVVEALTKEDILELRNELSDIKEEIQGHMNRITNIGIEKCNHDLKIKTLEKLELVRELNEQETKALEAAKLSIVELDRQLEVRTSKLSDANIKHAEIETTIKKYAVEQTRDLLEKSVRLEKERFDLIEEHFRVLVKEVMDAEAQFAIREKEIAQLKSDLVNYAGATNYDMNDINNMKVHLGIKNPVLSNAQRREILAKVKDINIYFSKKYV